MRYSSILFRAWFVCGAVLSAVGCLSTTSAAKASSEQGLNQGLPGLKGLMPKMETGSLRYLERFPDHDGRGVVVAVLDTGVDPGAEGLRTTTTGQPKIIDLIDATGSGDVDTSVVVRVEPGEDSFEGLTGRALKFDSQWTNPSGEYRLGIKPAYELFPSGVVSRLRTERSKEFRKQHRRLVGEVQSKLDALKANKEESGHDEDSREKKREDLRARLEALEGMMNDYEDPGPVFDCVVFHDGEHWRAVLDSDEDGDLADETLLRPYKVNQDYASFGPESMVHYGVNVYDEGNILSIVVDSGMHGTHVAGIIAGYHPEYPDLNGVAPGAQIVSVKIGDSRIGGMETASALDRAMTAVVENRCDLINLSFGEAAVIPNQGPLIELFRRVVRERDVIFVSSAGNAGPALSTVGAPGGATSEILGVGAAVSPEMMRDGYSMLDELPETFFTWSSRGPTFDGDWGVDLCAPGAAISPVPKWTLRRNQMANGTSMASPNACGGIALILSGLKQNKQPYSPRAVRLALENTARPVEGAEIFSQGRGMIQIDRAAEWLEQNLQSTSGLPWFEINVGQGQRGVYLRNARPEESPYQVNVHVQPWFKEKEPHETRVDYQQFLRLRSTAPWVRTPETLALMHGGRRFQIEVDVSQLDEGAHAAEIEAFDMERESLGPLFRIPVTVIRPHSLRQGEAPHFEEALSLGPGDLKRFFFQPPPSAVTAKVQARAVGHGEAKSLTLHARQLPLGVQDRDAGHQRRFRLKRDQTEEWTIPVHSHDVLELCLAQYWSEPGESGWEFEIEFLGVEARPDSIFIQSGERSTPVLFHSPLQSVELKPAAKLDHWRRTIPPSKHELTALAASRDRGLDLEPAYQLALSYSFKLPAEGVVTPRFPGLNDRLYSAEFQSQLWMAFNKNKKWLFSNDAYPEGRSMDKGEYVIRLHLRHRDRETLERLKELPMILEGSLKSPASLSWHDDADGALLKREKRNTVALNQNESKRLFISEPSPDSIPDFLRPGDVLTGTVDDSEGRLRAGIQWTLSASASSGKDESGQAAASNEKPESLADLQEQAHEFRVDQLEALSKAGQYDLFDELWRELEEEGKLDRKARLIRLRRLDGGERKKHLPEIVTLIDSILGEIDRNTLIEHVALRDAIDSKKDETADKKLEELKSTYLDLLYRKGRALAYMELPDDETVEETMKDSDWSAETIEKAFEENFSELSRWVDTTEESWFKLHIRRDRRHGRYGKALELLHEYLEKEPTDRLLLEKRIRVLEEAGWELWAKHFEQRQFIEFPKSYPPF